MAQADERRAAIAVTRFGLGARPGEIAAVAAGPLDWLLTQLEPVAAPVFPDRPDTAALAREGAWIEASKGYDEARRWRGTTAEIETLARVRHGATTPAGFRERWALFWANHFALAPADFRSEALSGAFMRDVVDRHAVGRFEDMAVDAARHPAMLFSLEQPASVGPNSAHARQHGGGLNENMGRETLELHTMGVGSAYAQADVIELSKALAGRIVGEGGYAVDPSRREPGTRRLLGRTYPEGGGQADAMVRDAARRPETHRRLAMKVARHFVADDPPPALVDRLEGALARSDGSLRMLAEALATAPESWAAKPRKLKTPYEHLVSTLRAADVTPDDGAKLNGMLHAMGQHPMQARSPAGASDVAEAWATPLSMVQRTNLAMEYGTLAPHADSRRFARDVLGPLATQRTMTTLLNEAVDRRSAFALVLMSPEFQRR